MGVALEVLARVASDSLFVVSGVYARRYGGEPYYEGERPGPGWHAHGCFKRWLYVLVGGRPRRVRVWKQRWLSPDGRRTCHSRPPDDLPSLWSCSLIVLLSLWAWLGGGRGVESCRQLFGHLEGHVTSRTVRRWLQRALPFALKIQQQIRLAAMERSEPRPLEYWFPGGLSPPVGLERRRWGAPATITQLWRAMGVAILGSAKLQIPVALLLAEARKGGDSKKHSSRP